MKENIDQTINQLIGKLSLSLSVATIPFIFAFNEIKPGFGNITIVCWASLTIISFFRNVISVKISNNILLLTCIGGLSYYSSKLTIDAGIHLLIFACFGFPFIIFNSKEYIARYFYVGLLFFILTARVFSIFPFNQNEYLIQSPLFIYKLIAI